MRPNLSKVRTAQILEGATRCVAHHGVGGLTLEAVAAEAGMSRSHIRHYMGNREDLLNSLVEHLGTRYSERLNSALSGVSPSEQLSAALDHLFGDYWDADEQADSAAIDALIAFSANNPEGELTLLPYYLAIESTLTRAVESSPNYSGPPAADTAYSILCLAFGSSSMRTMGFPVSRRESARTIAYAVTGECKSGNAAK